MVTIMKRNKVGAALSTDAEIWALTSAQRDKHWIAPILDSLHVSVALIGLEKRFIDWVKRRRWQAVTQAAHSEAAEIWDRSCGHRRREIRWLVSFCRSAVPFIRTVVSVLIRRLTLNQDQTESPSKKTTKVPSSLSPSSISPRSTANLWMPNRSNQLIATRSPVLP